MGLLHYIGVHTWPLVSIHGPWGSYMAQEVIHGPRGSFMVLVVIGPRESSIVLGGHTWSKGAIHGLRGLCMILVV